MFNEQQHIIAIIFMLAGEESFTGVVGLIVADLVARKETVKDRLIEIDCHSSPDEELKMWPDLEHIFCARCCHELFQVC